MAEAIHLQYALGLSGILFAILVGLLKWSANQLFSRLDEITGAIRNLGNLQQRFDVRLNTLETRCAYEHGTCASSGAIQ